MGQASALPLNLIELLEWFEDTVALAGEATVVTIASPDAQGRLATLQTFYELLVSHTRFGGGWPTKLSPGSLVPTVVSEARTMVPPRAIWLAACASEEPFAEVAQIERQLSALAGFPAAERWVHEAADREFAAALLGPAAETPGDLLAHALGALDDSLDDVAATMGRAARLLDEATTGSRLLADGGALGLDGPRLATRGLLAAGWIQRLAARTPVVLVLDEAHRAGPFMDALVNELLDAPSRVLIVLAGEPEQPGDAYGATLAGPFATTRHQAVDALSLPSGAHGRLAAALASAGPHGLYTHDHLVAIGATGEVADEGDVFDVHADLLAAGWIRELTPQVFTIATRGRLRAIERQLGELVRIDHEIGRTTLGTLAAPTDEPLAELILGASRAAAAGPSTDAAWAYAVQLARRGEMLRAVDAGVPAATDVGRLAVIEAWRAIAIRDRWDETDVVPVVEVEAAIAAGRDDPTHLLVLAATCARTRPLAASSLLDAALGGLGRGDPHDDDSARGTVAAARIALSIGDLTATRRALGEGLWQLVPERVVRRLDALGAWTDRPGVVARGFEVAESLHLIDALRHSMPASGALGRALVTWIERLERFDRLQQADDAVQIASEACAIFGASRARPPLWLWRARTALAACHLGQGRAHLAIDQLDALLTEQHARVGHEDLAHTTTKVWLARALLDAQRPDEAHAFIDEALHARLRNDLDHHPHLLATHHWHATCLVALGRCGDAVSEIDQVVRRRSTLLAPDDEDLLASRHLLGSALARSGDATAALPHLREVVRRRSSMEIPESRRLLAARHSYGVCLMMLGLHTEGATELDAVVASRAVAMDTGDDLTAARSDRAVCLLMTHRWVEALADLDVVLTDLARQRAPHFDRVLAARQQRAMCLRALDRAPEAVAELDQILAATVMWPAGHPLVDNVRAMRSGLLDRLATAR